MLPAPLRNSNTPVNDVLKANLVSQFMGWLNCRDLPLPSGHPHMLLTNRKCLLQRPPTPCSPTSPTLWSQPLPRWKISIPCHLPAIPVYKLPSHTVPLQNLPGPQEPPFPTTFSITLNSLRPLALSTCCSLRTSQLISQPHSQNAQGYGQNQNTHLMDSRIIIFHLCWTSNSVHWSLKCPCTKCPQ